MHHLLLLIFLFLLGSCVGSFLNVVVWRLPRVEFQENEGWLRGLKRTFWALSYPPSRCPKCGTTLKWYDNLPVVGWLKLRGRCRHCREPISPRYPIVEAVCGLMFAGYYAAFFMPRLTPPLGPCATRGWMLGGGVGDWPIFGLYLFLLAGLLAASLIDLELMIIPLEIPYVIAPIAILVHAIFDQRSMPGALILMTPAASAVAAGAGVGLVISIIGWARGWLPHSFPMGEPILEMDREAIEKEIAALRRAGQEVPPLPPPYTRSQINGEMRKEMAFLLPPMLLGVGWFAATTFVAPLAPWWRDLTLNNHHLCALLGALLGGMIGGFVIWLARILGTLGIGRVAMGLGDVHLMFAVGTVIGAFDATVAFFLAPFFAIVLAIWMFLTRRRRELPFGPYLSLGTAAVMLFSCRIWLELSPGLEGLGFVVRRMLGAGH